MKTIQVTSSDDDQISEPVRVHSTTPDNFYLWVPSAEQTDQESDDGNDA